MIGRFIALLDAVFEASKLAHGRNIQTAFAAKVARAPDG